MTTQPDDEPPLEQLDAEIRAIEDADPTETSGAALLRGAKEEIERLEAVLAEALVREERKDAALKPFAEYIDPRRKLSAALVITAGSQMAKVQLTMGDCYATAEALAAPVPEPKPGTEPDFDPNAEGYLNYLKRKGMEPAPKSEAEFTERLARVEYITDDGFAARVGNAAARMIVLSGVLETTHEAERRVVKAAQVWRYSGGFDEQTKLFKAIDDLTAQQQEPTPDEESGDG